MKNNASIIKRLEAMQERHEMGGIDYLEMTHNLGANIIEAHYKRLDRRTAQAYDRFIQLKCGFENQDSVGLWQAVDFYVSAMKSFGRMIDGKTADYVNGLLKGVADPLNRKRTVVGAFGNSSSQVDDVDLFIYGPAEFSVVRDRYDGNRIIYPVRKLRAELWIKYRQWLASKGARPVVLENGSSVRGVSE